MNRIILCSLLMLFSSFALVAQPKVMSFEDAFMQNVEVNQLDEEYTPAVGAGEKVIYKGQEQAFVQSYSKMLHKEKEKRFKKLVEEFIETYKFELPSKQKFAQCSPVVYQDVK